jgi:sensor histidine kinase regulating citrate/malate metabolism
VVNPIPFYVNERQSDLRGVKEGWYAIDEHGRLMFGPFFNPEACLTKIGQPGRD